MKLKSAYDNFEEESTLTALECKDESLTQQHDEHDANINNIVNTYMRTGMAEFHNKPPIETDFEMITNMQDALELIVQAKDAFMEQPAGVRARFNNDPALFVEFCSNEQNRDEMRKLGLMSDEETIRHNLTEQNKANLAAAYKADAEAYRKAQAAPKS